MKTKAEEYKICKERSHQKSGQVVGDEQAAWQICAHCGTYYRFVTELVEKNVPKK